MVQGGVAAGAEREWVLQECEHSSLWLLAMKRELTLQEM